MEDTPVIDKTVELQFPDGRPRCTGVGAKGQCKNMAGWNTDHMGVGVCVYHEEKGVELITQEGSAPAARSHRKPIYDKGLKGDAQKLYKMLSDQPMGQSLKLTDELAIARGLLLKLQQDFESGAKNSDDYFGDMTKLIDTISKVVERSQPKSTLTINNVQNVLLKVIDVIAQEVNDPQVIERIVQKLSGIQVVQQ